MNQEQYSSITIKDIISNEEIKTYIKKGNEYLGEMGFTEHGFAHAKIASDTASHILKELGYDEDMVNLASIAGYMHDIGNIVNRVNHAHSGGIMAFNILRSLNMCPEYISIIASAIGNHDEHTAEPVNPVAAALIIADKSDVRRTRVRNTKSIMSDIHDRVNYAVVKSSLNLNTEDKTIELNLSIDTEICPVMEYFEIFLTRMTLCRKAALYLNLNFELVINNSRLL